MYFGGFLLKQKQFLCNISVTQTPEIKVLGFYNGLKKVNERDKADLVQIEVKRDKVFNTYHLHKKDYNSDRTFEKPVKKWSELPELI